MKEEYSGGVFKPVVGWKAYVVEKGGAVDFSPGKARKFVPLRARVGFGAGEARVPPAKSVETAFHNVGILAESTIEEGFNGSLCKAVVGVDEGHVVCPQALQTSIARSRETAVFLVDDFHKG